MFEKKGLRQIVGEDAVLTQSNISEIYTHDWAHDKIGRCLTSFNIFLQRLIWIVRKIIWKIKTQTHLNVAVAVAAVVPVKVEGVVRLTP